jgi:hypothetical protein
MKLYSAADLHSNNHLLAIIDEQDKRVLEKRLPNDLATTLQTLEPYRAGIVGIAVESTFNWYWLVDGLIEAGYTVKLVNTSKVRQYEGLKYTDDRHDAFWLAHQMRLGILPTGYIYPKEQRAVRDLLRERRRLVRQRTTVSLVLSFPTGGLNAELLCVLSVQSLPAAALHGLGADDASNKPTGEPTAAASQRLRFRVCRLSRMVASMPGCLQLAERRCSKGINRLLIRRRRRGQEP